jgi:hypothetical protein
LADGGGRANSRDNKRYLDKKNKKQREERKKEDNVRVRTLVGMAALPLGLLLHHCILTRPAA